MARSATLTSFSATARPRVRPAAVRAEHTPAHASAPFLDGAGRRSTLAGGTAALAVGWILLWAFFVVGVAAPGAALHARADDGRAAAGIVAYHATP